MMQKNRINSEKIANIVIAVAIASASFVLVYGVIRYERVLNWQFGGISAFDGIIFFYIVPSILIVFFGIATRLNRVYKMNIAIAFISTILTVYVVEGVLLLFNPDGVHFQRTIALKRIGKTYDSRTTLEVLHQLRQQQKRVFPAVTPAHFVKEGIPFIQINGEPIYPLSAISNATTVLSREQGEWLIYESDEYGFHNPKGFYHPGNVDIAVIGDSFTHGAGVPSDKNAVALIRDVYKHTLNFRLAGSGPLIELGIFREYVESLQPKLVLWMYFSGNDLCKDLEKEKSNAILLRYLDKSYRQNLISLQSDTDQYLIDYINGKIREEEKIAESLKEQKTTNLKNLLLGFLFLRHLRMQFHLTFIPPDNQSEKPTIEISPSHYDFDLFRTILMLTRDTVNSWGGKFYFVYLPSHQFIANPAHIKEKRAYTQILAFVKNLEIPIIDVRQEFLAQDDPLSVFPFRRDGHYNEKGYAIVAETILETIEKDGF